MLKSKKQDISYLLNAAQKETNYIFSLKSKGTSRLFSKATSRTDVFSRLFKTINVVLDW